ncbi:DUF1482 family protein [Symbiopectobacterium sp.]
MYALVVFICYLGHGCENLVIDAYLTVIPHLIFLFSGLDGILKF